MILLGFIFWGPHLIKIKFVWPFNPPKVTVHLFQVHTGDMLNLFQVMSVLA